MSIARKVRRSGGIKIVPRTEMVFIPGAEFTMGSDHHYQEEKPAHRVRVAGFWIDKTPVTNAEFARFVKATGHVTFAEIEPGPQGLSRSASAYAARGFARVHEVARSG